MFGMLLGGVGEVCRTLLVGCEGSVGMFLWLFFGQFLDSEKQYQGVKAEKHNGKKTIVLLLFVRSLFVF